MYFIDEIKWNEIEWARGRVASSAPSAEKMIKWERVKCFFQFMDQRNYLIWMRIARYWELSSECFSQRRMLSPVTFLGCLGKWRVRDFECSRNGMAYTFFSLRYWLASSVAHIQPIHLAPRRRSHKISSTNLLSAATNMNSKFPIKWRRCRLEGNAQGACHRPNLSKKMWNEN